MLGVHVDDYIVEPAAQRAAADVRSDLPCCPIAIGGIYTTDLLDTARLCLEAAGLVCVCHVNPLRIRVPLCKMIRLATESGKVLINSFDFID